MSQEISDEQLMEQYSGGDYGAFEQLYHRHRLPLMRYLKRQLQNPSIAEETFQEVWFKLINAQQRYQPTAMFKTYLYHIAHNALVDYYRKQNSRPQEAPADAEQLASLEDNCNGPEQQVSHQSQMQSLLQLIADLPVEQRESFLLREDSGFTLEEIASVTGTSRETAKSRLRYAIDKLRRGLEALYGRL